MLQHPHKRNQFIGEPDFLNFNQSDLQTLLEWTKCMLKQGDMHIIAYNRISYWLAETLRAYNTIDFELGRTYL